MLTFCVNNVNNINFMFFGCRKLISLPDISKWCTNNVKYMAYLFSNCLVLLSLPNISKWLILPETDISNIFNGCFSLSYNPNVFNNNTIKYENFLDYHLNLLPIME